MDVREKTKLVKRKCFDLGFSHVGISKSVFLEKEAKRLEVWLSNDFNGKMKYMEWRWIYNWKKRGCTSVVSSSCSDILALNGCFSCKRKCFLIASKEEHLTQAKLAQAHN